MLILFYELFHISSTKGKNFIFEWLLELMEHSSKWLYFPPWFSPVWAISCLFVLFGIEKILCHNICTYWFNFEFLFLHTIYFEWFVKTNVDYLLNTLILIQALYWSYSHLDTIKIAIIQLTLINSNPQLLTASLRFQDGFWLIHVSKLAYNFSIGSSTFCNLPTISRS